MTRWTDALAVTSTESDRLYLHWLAGRLVSITRGTPSFRRPPDEGDRCVCGRPAVTVVVSDRWGDVPCCRS